jgi:hypothetical protein
MLLANRKTSYQHVRPGVMVIYMLIRTPAMSHARPVNGRASFHEARCGGLSLLHRARPGVMVICMLTRTPAMSHARPVNGRASFHEARCGGLQSKSTEVLVVGASVSMQIDVVPLRSFKLSDERSIIVMI